MVKNDNVEFTYNGLVLMHLNRISQLSATIPFIQFSDNGMAVHHTEEDKMKSFFLSIDVLDKFIHEDFRHKDTDKEIDDLKLDNDKEKLESYLKKLKNLINGLHKRSFFGDKYGFAMEIIEDVE